MLGSASTNYPAGYASGKTLSLNFAGASYYVLSSGANLFNLNSIYWEVSSTPSAAAVPETTTWAMMMAGFGVIGLAVRRRRIAGNANA